LEFVVFALSASSSIQFSYNNLAAIFINRIRKTKNMLVSFSQYDSVDCYSTVYVLFTDGCTRTWLSCTEVCIDLYYMFFYKHNVYKHTERDFW